MKDRSGDEKIEFWYAWALRVYKLKYMKGEEPGEFEERWEKSERRRAKSEKVKKEMESD